MIWRSGCIGRKFHAIPGAGLTVVLVLPIILNVPQPRIVIDTNVLVSALRSRRGASFKLLTLLGSAKFQINVSVPLVLEYEDAAKREAHALGLRSEDIDDLLDYLCRVAKRRRIFFLWRPLLKDPKDDLVLEVAVEAGCDFIITYNQRDFAGSGRFGIEILTPKQFLTMIGAIK